MKKLAIAFSLMLSIGCRDHMNVVKTGFEGKPLPAFSVLLMDSLAKLNTSDIPSGRPIVVFYFNPYCPYCRAQTQEMLGNMQSLSNIRFVMLSNFPFASIKGFSKEYKLDIYPNITVVDDYDAFFGSYYKASGVPYTAIYNKEKNLKKVIVGPFKADDLKNISME